MMKSIIAMAVVGASFTSVACAVREEQIVVGRATDGSVEFQGRGPTGSSDQSASITTLTFYVTSENVITVSLDGGKTQRSIAELERDSSLRWIVLENPLTHTPDFAKGDWVGLDRSDVKIYAYKGAIKVVTVFPCNDPLAIISYKGVVIRFPLSVSEIVDRIGSTSCAITSYRLKK